MKWIVWVSGLIVCLLFGSVGVIIESRDAEELLIGSWKEVSWHCEKSDGGVKNDSQWREVSQGLIVHEAEMWNFRSNKSLLIYPQQTGTGQVAGHWRVKGRGNILELKEGNTTEYYQIEQITKDSFVLHFSFDLQVKGIVKIVFKRVA